MSLNMFTLPVKTEVVDQKTIEAYVDNLLNVISIEQDYLVVRFLKETGLRPEDCVICTQWVDGVHKIWVEKKAVAK